MGGRVLLLHRIVNEERQSTRYDGSSLTFGHQGKRVAASFATRVLNDPRALDRSPEGEGVGYHEIASI